MPLFHGNALSAAVLPGPGRRGRPGPPAAFLGLGLSRPTSGPYGCTYFNTVGRAIAHILATPADRPRPRPPLRFVLGPETSAAGQGRVQPALRRPAVRGVRIERERHHPATGPPAARPGALGRARAGRRGHRRPRHRGGAPRARLRRARPAAQRRPSHRRARRAGRRPVHFEGYYNNPEAEAERTRNGWYWSGDLGYRDEAGFFYFAGRTGDWLRVDGENFAAAPWSGSSARFPGVDGVAVYPVPDAAPATR